MDRISCHILAMHALRGCLCIYNKTNSVVEIAHAFNGTINLTMYLSLKILLALEFHNILVLCVAGNVYSHFKQQIFPNIIIIIIIVAPSYNLTSESKCAQSI